MPAHLGPLVACLLAVGAPACGDERWGIDRDGDGRYSLDELRAFYPDLSEPAYTAIDANNDGDVTPGEFRQGQDDGLLSEPVVVQDSASDEVPNSDGI